MVKHAEDHVRKEWVAIYLLVCMHACIEIWVTTTKKLKNGSVFFFSPCFLDMHDILVDMQSVVTAREAQPSLASLLYYSLLSLYEFGVVEFILCPASAWRCQCPLDAGVVKLRSCARINKFADGDENPWSMHAAGSLLPAAVAWVWRFLSSSSSSLQLGTEILGFPLYIVVLLQLIAEGFQREGRSCRGCFHHYPSSISPLLL